MSEKVCKNGSMVPAIVREHGSGYFDVMCSECGKEFSSAHQDYEIQCHLGKVDVVRFNCDADGDMDLEVDGALVWYEDYEKLAARNRELEAEGARKDSVIKKMVSVAGNATRRNRELTNKVHELECSAIKELLTPEQVKDIADSIKGAAHDS